MVSSAIVAQADPSDHSDGLKLDDECAGGPGDSKCSLQAIQLRGEPVQLDEDKTDTDPNRFLPILVSEGIKAYGGSNTIGVCSHVCNAKGYSWSWCKNGWCDCTHGGANYYGSLCSGGTASCAGTCYSRGWQDSHCLNFNRLCHCSNDWYEMSYTCFQS
ncbi:unnamed protein product [Cladocopium goreaui]|uniref:Uncharacterized protein n=1 Tax=Cladocopium goreaui TaxID=2562237 RepID=A0A9P1GAB9_9DINO|nr:unnamed protein product [Cladocopium goreaui]